MPFSILADYWEKLRPSVIWILLTISIFAGWGITKLGFDDLPRGIFKTQDAEFELMEQTFQQFGSDDNDCLLVAESPNLFSPEGLTALRSLVLDLKGVKGVASVNSLLDVKILHRKQLPRFLLPFNRSSVILPSSLIPPVDASADEYIEARKEALRHPLVAGHLLSPDAKTTLITIQLGDEKDLGMERIQQLLQPVRNIIERYQGQHGLNLRLTGLAPIRAEIYQTIRRESLRFIIVGMILAFGLSLILFRRLTAILIVGSAAMLGVFWTLGALGLIGEKITVLTTVLPTLVMVIGFTDSVHLMFDIRHSISLGDTPRVAAREALRHLGLACFLTSVTTMIGFSALLLTDAEIIRRFGWTCAIGTGLTFLGVIFAVPWLSSFEFARRVAVRHARDPLTSVVMWGLPVLRWILKHHRFVTICGTTLTLAMGFISVGLIPSNRLTEALPDGNQAREAVNHLDRKMGGTLNTLVVLQWPKKGEFPTVDVLRALHRVEQACARQPRANYPLSLWNLLESFPTDDHSVQGRMVFLRRIPESILKQWMSLDTRQALLTFRLEDSGSDVHQKTFQSLERSFRDIEREFPGLNIRLTGTTVVASRNLNQMILDLSNSLGGAALMIFSIMTIGFRSIRLGLISIVPNMFPMVFTTSLLVLTDRRLELTSVIVFSICLGIAVDDTIHFLSRFRRELKEVGDLHLAIERTYVAVGSAMVTTMLVLLAGFASVLLSELPGSRLFAGLSCIAIGSAILGDLILLPAILATFGHKLIPKK